MNQSDVERFLRLYHSEVKRTTHRKVIATCPFAPWTHSGGRDKNPSFAALDQGGGRWSYKCLTCGESGTLRGMFWRHFALSGSLNVQANAIVYADEDDEDTRVPVSRLDYRPGGADAGPAVVVDWDAIQAPRAQVPMGHGRVDSEPEPPAASFIERVRAAPVPAYAERLGLAEAHRAWRLGYDEQSRRWIHPVCEPDGEVVGYTGRIDWTEAHCFRCGEVIAGEKFCPSCRQSYVKYKHHPGRWRKTSLFGADMVTEGNPVVVVEGTTDALRLWSLGVRDSVAILGASPNVGQMDLLARLTRDVVVMGDGDVAGRAMGQAVSEACRARSLAVEVVDLPEGTDPGDLTASGVLKVLPARCQSSPGSGR